MAQPNKKAEVVPVKKAQTTQLAPVANPFADIERMFAEYFPSAWARPWNWRWPATPALGELPLLSQPKVDVLDRDNEVVVRAELPGVEKDNVEVSLTENSVSIRALVSKEDEKEKGDYYHKETMRGEYARTLSLPATVDTEKTKAKLQDGVLELVLPKIERAKHRTIKVE